MQAFSILWAMAWKGTAILLAASLAVWCMRGRSASARHTVWTAAMAALLSLPALSVALPALDVWIPAVPGTSVLFEVTATGHAGAAQPVSNPAAAGPATLPVPAPAPFPWRLWVVRLSLAGSALLLFQMLAAHAALWRVTRRGKAIPAAAIDGIPVFETPAGSMPMAAGLLRPAILMPADASGWDEHRRRVVLEHEAAHVRRGDLAAQFLARLALALNWWNPLVWRAWNEFVKERERAADDLVLMSGARASEYAAHLLEVARSLKPAPPLAWAAVAMARSSQLEGRLIAILDARRNRGAAAPKAALAACVAAVVMIAPFAAVRAQTPSGAVDPAEIDAAIRAAASQKNHEILEQAAAAYEKLRKYDAAQKLLESALTIRGDVAGPRSARYAAGLVNLGDLEIRRGKFAEGEAFYNRAAALGDMAEVVPALIFLGMRAYGRQDDAAAADFFQRAINSDPRGPNAGRANTWLANVRARRPEAAAEAETLYLQAMSLQNPASPEYATTLDFYSFFQKQQGRDAESLATQNRARDIRRAAVIAENSRPDRVVVSAVRIGAGMTAPQLLYKIEPAYSAEARAAKYQGTVLLNVVIDPDGTPSDISINRSLGLGLDEKAIESVRQWRFKPGLDAQGNPVRVQATIEVNFRLL